MSPVFNFKATHVPAKISCFRTTSPVICIPAWSCMNITGAQQSERIDMFSPTDKLTCALISSVLKSNLWEPSLCLCPCRDSDRNYAFQFNNHQFILKNIYYSIKHITVSQQKTEHSGKEAFLWTLHPSDAFSLLWWLWTYFSLFLSFCTCSDSVQAFTAMTHVRLFLFLRPRSVFSKLHCQGLHIWPIQIFSYVE